MKKNVLLFVLGILCSSSTLFAQPQCSQNVWMELDNKQILKAVKTSDDCVRDNPNSPDAWLMRANAYLQRHQEEATKLEKDSKYVVRNPDAIIIANECFIKAQEINPNIEPRTKMIAPTRGRVLCAEPLYFKGLEAFDAKKYEKARDLFKTSITNFNLDLNPKAPNYQGLIYNMGIFYSQLAETYTILGDHENAKKTIIDGTRKNTSFPNIYLQLYDLYKEEGDTINALKIIQSAKRNVADSLALDIYTYELDYYAFTNNVEKMNKTRDLIFEKYGMTISTITRVVAYLNKSDQLESAEELLLMGLKIDSLNFDLNQQMAFRYFSEGLRFQKEAMQASDYRLMANLNNKKTEAFENAHKWADKAYHIKNDNRENNIMLYELKVILSKTDMPEDLELKVKHYRGEE